MFRLCFPFGSNNHHFRERRLIYEDDLDALMGSLDKVQEQEKRRETQMKKLDNLGRALQEGHDAPAMSAQAQRYATAQKKFMRAEFERSGSAQNTLLAGAYAKGISLRTSVPTINFGKRGGRLIVTAGDIKSVEAARDIARDQMLAKHHWTDRGLDAFAQPKEFASAAEFEKYLRAMETQLESRHTPRLRFAEQKQWHKVYSALYWRHKRQTYIQEAGTKIASGNPRLVTKWPRRYILEFPEEYQEQVILAAKQDPSILALDAVRSNWTPAHFNAFILEHVAAEQPLALQYTPEEFRGLSERGIADKKLESRVRRVHTTARDAHRKGEITHEEMIDRIGRGETEARADHARVIPTASTDREPYREAVKTHITQNTKDAVGRRSVSLLPFVASRYHEDWEKDDYFDVLKNALGVSLNPLLSRDYINGDWFREDVAHRDQLKAIVMGAPVHRKRALLKGIQTQEHIKTLDYHIGVDGFRVLLLNMPFDQSADLLNTNVGFADTIVAFSKIDVSVDNWLKLLARVGSLHLKDDVIVKYLQKFPAVADRKTALGAMDPKYNTAAIRSGAGIP